MIREERYFFSERLYIREIQREDSEILVRWRSEEENFRYFFNPQPVTLEEHLKWFDAYLKNQERIDFILMKKDTGEYIGTVGVQNISKLYNLCSISYMIGEQGARGKGYAKEAINGICQYVVKKFGINCINAEIHKDNIKSKELVKKMGFKEVGYMDKEYAQFLIYNKHMEV